MLGIEFINYINQGNKPIIEFTDEAYEREQDVDQGMRARVISVVNDGEGVYKAICDLNEFADYNKNFEKPVWYDAQGNPTLKWSETNFYPRDGIATIYFDETYDIFWEVVEDNSLFVEYQDSGMEESYVKWLENEVLRLRR